MVEDPKLIEFLIRSSLDGEVGKVDEDFIKLGEEKIKKYVENCDLSYSGEDWRLDDKEMKIVEE